MSQQPPTVQAPSLGHLAVPGFLHPANFLKAGMPLLPAFVGTGPALSKDADSLGNSFDLHVHQVVSVLRQARAATACEFFVLVRSSDQHMVKTASTGSLMAVDNARSVSSILAAAAAPDVSLVAVSTPSDAEPNRLHYFVVPQTTSGTPKSESANTPVSNDQKSEDNDVGQLSSRSISNSGSNSPSKRRRSNDAAASSNKVRVQILPSLLSRLESLDGLGPPPREKKILKHSLIEFLYAIYGGRVDYRHRHRPNSWPADVEFKRPSLLKLHELQRLWSVLPALYKEQTSLESSFYAPPSELKSDDDTDDEASSTSVGE